MDIRITLTNSGGPKAAPGMMGAFGATTPDGESKLEVEAHDVTDSISEAFYSAAVAVNEIVRIEASVIPAGVTDEDEA